MQMILKKVEIMIMRKKSWFIKVNHTMAVGVKKEILQ